METLDDLRAQIAVAVKNQHGLHGRVVRLEEWADVVSSPLYKRIWFWLCGWRWKELGRWRGADRSRWPGPAQRWWLK